MRSGLLPEELRKIKFESPVTIIGYEILLTKAFYNSVLYFLASEQQSFPISVLCLLHSSCLRS